MRKDKATLKGKLMISLVVYFCLEVVYHSKFILQIRLDKKNLILTNQAFFSCYATVNPVMDCLSGNTATTSLLAK
jgi:hypothetical protein